MTLEEALQQLNIIQDLIPVGNSNRPGTRLRPTHITIHNTDNAGPGADARAHARYVKSAEARRRQVSWHYTVDDRVVMQHLPTNEVGWHAGRGNSKSIGIEICMHQGMPEPAAYERAALLAAVLSIQNNVSVPDKIVRHFDWTQKHCPRVLLDKPNGWPNFRARVKTLRDALSAPILTEAVPHPAVEIEHANDDHDVCEIFNTKAPRGAARGTAGKKKKGKKKAAAAKKKRKAASKSKVQKGKTRKRKGSKGRSRG